MKRSWITRSTSLKPGKRIRAKKPRTAEEEREQFAYEYGSKDRCDWITWLGCLACYRVPCQNHHTENDGKSRKGPASSIVPLCPEHHTELHQHGVLTFEAKYAGPLHGLLLCEHAARLEAFWQQREGSGGGACVE